MELISLRLNNYGPHSDSVIDFTQFRVAAILGRKGKDFRKSNGTGKSHINDGLSWALFETKREDNIDFLKWGEKKGFVKVRFKEGNEEYIVKRTLVRKKDRLYSKLTLKNFKNGEWQDISDDGIDGKKNTQKKIEDVIKANEEIFLHTCYIKQGEIDALMKMRPNERREVFSRPEGLLIYQKALKLARKKLSVNRINVQISLEKLKDAKSEFKEMFSDVANVKELEKELKDKKDRRTDLSSRIQEMERERDKNSQSKSAKDKIKIHQKSIDDAKLVIDEIEAENNDVISGGKEAEEKIEELTRKIRKYDLDLITVTKMQISTALSKTVDSIKLMKLKVEETQESLDKIKKICGECGNKLTDDQYIEKKKRLKGEIKGLDNQLEELYEEKNKLETELEEIETSLSKLKNLEKEKGRLKDRLTQYNTVWNKLDQAKVNFQKIKDDNTPKILELKKQVTESSITDEEIDDQKEKYNKVLQKIGSLNERINGAKDIESQKIEKLKNLKILIKSKLNLMREFKLISLTVDMLKNMPAEIIREAVPEIEQYSNEILQRFEHSNIQLSIITKDDKDEETFDWKVSIDGKQTGFKSISGGEKLRVSFAFRIGNAIRLSHVRGCQFDFLLIDEVDALDEAGVEEFTEMIGKLSKMFKHIIVVSHDEKIKQYFNNQILVTKIGKDASVKLVKG